MWLDVTATLLNQLQMSGSVYDWLPTGKVAFLLNQP
jgi:hypothetical protein